MYVLFNHLATQRLVLVPYALLRDLRFHKGQYEAATSHLADNLASRQTSRLHVVYVPPLHRRSTVSAVRGRTRPSVSGRHSSCLEQSGAAHHHGLSSAAA